MCITVLLTYVKIFQGLFKHICFIVSITGGVRCVKVISSSELWEMLKYFHQ